MRLLFVLFFLCACENEKLTRRVFVMPSKFTYKLEVIQDEVFEKTMDTLGLQGWELVTARRAGNGGEFPTYSYEVIMKKPIP